MKRPRVLILCTLLSALASNLPGEPERERLFWDEVEPILIEHCYDCHGDGMDKGDFALDDFDSLTDHLDDRDVWYEVWKNVRANLMPPPEKPQLAEATKQKVLHYIEDKIFHIDRENPDPGRVTIRRLNREEYRHTVKDILNVDFLAEDFFPPDDTGYGFDTIGDVLSISPLLMEKYLEAAKIVAEEAVPVGGPQILTWWFDADDMRGTENEKHRIGYIPLDTPRRFEGNLWVERDGEFDISIHFQVRGSDEATEETGELAFGVDGETLVRRKIGWDNSRELVVRKKAQLKRGSDHRFFLAMEPDQPRERGEKRLYVTVDSIRLRGPLDGSYKDYPWEFRHIFSEGPPPDSQTERDVYREKILRQFARQLFRRPPDDETLARLVQLARQKDEQPGMRFEHGIRHAFTAMLVSPRFLMRSELQPDPNNPDRVQTLDEFQLASRLSYALWLSAPDEELLRLAEEGQLRAQLRQQGDRMLADKRSDRFVRSFVGQWLQARDVETIHIDARRALGIGNLGQARRTFSGRLRRAMREETELFFGHVLKNNLPAEELLTARYTFLNEDLAEWYDIEGVKGSHMRLVELKPGSNRGGILKQATFQIVTSNPTRTSPVKRGLFVLENLLAVPPPSAVPDVPPLEDSLRAGNRNLTLREALALHSKQKLCASCHARMDPIGLALENYSFAGIWMDNYKGKPIDTRGKLVTGETFENADQLSKILATTKREEFFTAITEKLFTFAIGRGVEYFDAPTIDAIVDQSFAEGGRLVDILYGVIESPAFQKRRGDGSLLAAREETNEKKENHE